AATKAAYRFWDNPRVDPDAIHAAHRDSTLHRLGDHPGTPILALQDTTSFDFTDHPDTTGLGSLAHRKRAGLWLHSVLAVSAAGGSGTWNGSWERPCAPARRPGR